MPLELPPGFGPDDETDPGYLARQEAFLEKCAQERVAKGLCPDCGLEHCCGAGQAQEVVRERFHWLALKAELVKALQERDDARRAGPWVEQAGSGAWLVMAPPARGIYETGRDVRYLVHASGGRYAWGTSGLVYFATEAEAKLAAREAPPWWPDGPLG